jgi:hypothetical protein
VPLVLCLLGSPLLPPAVWHPVAELLRANGWQVAEASSSGRAPSSFDDALASFLAAVPNDRDVILIPHSNAGLYVPALTADRRVAGYVFVDAVLPPSSGQVPMVPPDLYDFLKDKTDPDGVLPRWTQWWDEDISGLFPDADVQAEIERAEPRLPLSYFHGPARIPTSWDSRPGAYLSFGDTYGTEFADAASRGWPVRTIEGGHLHMLVNPAQVAAELAALMPR